MEQPAQAIQLQLSESKLHIHLLGDFRLVDADAFAIPIGSPRLQALLAYLVLHRDAPQLRQYLAFLLWPDSSEAQARTNLRQLVHSLRQTLPKADQFVHADAQTLQWQSEAPFWLDVAEFEEALIQADTAHQNGDLHAMRKSLELAINSYHGDLLPACYDDWILPERERLRQAFTGALERLILLLERQGQPRPAIAHAQRLLRHDPLREETYRALMRLHAACGDRAAVARVYNTCVTVLERELGVHPSPVSQETYEKLLMVDTQRRPITPPQPSNTNLPVPLTSFVGREAELAEIIHLLQTTRLLTLTGPGGCGKTRLALEAATNLVDQFPDGVWWVELASLYDPTLVPQAVASALGVRDPSGRPLQEALLDYLRSKKTLLLLDNCEHLVEACARLAEQWLSACPHLKILATSREALSIGGEITWLVPSLSLPDSEHSSPVEDLMRFESVSLFVERAAAVLPTFKLTAANAQIVAQICRRLDGIPLAIELAAARVKVLDVKQIAARLKNVFHLLGTGQRTALLRHQTLRAAMDWSYDLLSDQERMLFRRLSVFTGGFTLEAAEAICAGEGIATDEILELLSHLVDKSLVGVTQNRETRYHLLETICQYAQEKLQEAGEVETFRWQHSHFFLALAKSAEPKMKGAERPIWLNRLEDEYDNLRAVLTWSIQGSVAEIALEMAGALSWFWYFRGSVGEAREWLESALALSDTHAMEGNEQARAKALYWAGAMARNQGDYSAARSQLEESVRLWRQIGSVGRSGLAAALTDLGVVTGIQGDYSGGRSLQEESLAMYREIGDRWDLALTLYVLAMAVSFFEGNVALGRARFEESLAIFRELGDRWGHAMVLVGLAQLSSLQGEHATARAQTEESLALMREVGDKYWISRLLAGLGVLLQLQNDAGRAQSVLLESLALNREQGSQSGIAISLAGLAWVAALQGQPEQAARLFGAAEHFGYGVSAPIVGVNRPLYEQAVASARAALSAEAFTAAWAAGRAMTLEEAVAEALTITPDY